MKAGDIMMPTVVSVGPDASIREAMRLMLEHRISGLPVMDNDRKLIGIVTEGDFLRRVETGTERIRGGWMAFLMGPGRIAEEYVRSHGRKVVEVMTPDPVTIAEDTPLDEVVDLMEKRRIKRVPVMREGRVVGIVSRANLVHALASVVPDLGGKTAADAGIREQVLAALAKQPWARHGFVNAVVHGGTVELWGRIFDERERRAVLVAAENVAGVKDVKDHLVWVEPMGGMVVEPPADTSRHAGVG